MGPESNQRESIAAECCAFPFSAIGRLNRVRPTTHNLWAAAPFYARFPPAWMRVRPHSPKCWHACWAWLWPRRPRRAICYGPFLRSSGCPCAPITRSPCLGPPSAVATTARSKSSRHATTCPAHLPLQRPAQVGSRPANASARLLTKPSGVSCVGPCEIRASVHGVVPSTFSQHPVPSVQSMASCV